MPAKNTINISLTDEQVNQLDELMATGAYASRSEVFRENLRKQVEKQRFIAMVTNLSKKAEKLPSEPFDEEKLRKELYERVDQRKHIKDVSSKS
jgi:Arc/MetJ-type ribon-helix-helix transcriptional regulator